MKLKNYLFLMLLLNYFSFIKSESTVISSVKPFTLIGKVKLNNPNNSASILGPLTVSSIDLQLNANHNSEQYTLLFSEANQTITVYNQYTANNLRIDTLYDAKATNSLGNMDLPAGSVIGKDYFTVKSGYTGSSSITITVAIPKR